MATSKTSHPKSAILSLDQMRAAITRIKKRIEELEEFDPSSVLDRNDGRITKLEQAIDRTLVATFGPDTVEYIRYRRINDLDTAGYNLNYETPIGKVRESLTINRARAIEVFKGIIEGFEEEIGIEAPAHASSAQVHPAKDIAPTRSAFVVHGHDEAARETVARFLERINVVPVILHEQANKGRTIIEKIEAHSGVGFAVVLLTPDDVGAEKTATGSLKNRARQNVLLELGYFIGHLGRSKVCALKKGDVEVPSDFSGVVYTSMDEAGAWKQQLAKELDESGIPIDYNLAMRAK